LATQAKAKKAPPQQQQQQQPPPPQEQGTQDDGFEEVGNKRVRPAAPFQPFQPFRPAQPSHFSPTGLTMNELHANSDWPSDMALWKIHFLSSLL
jgi:hypothetical protein